MPELRNGDSNRVGDENIDISVVMACYTEERLPSIEAAVSSLRLQKLQPRAVIIAVDNNESLANLLRKRFDWVTVVLNDSNRGASSTRNRGVEEVATRFAAFLDDDETADPDWLVELTRPFADPEVVGTGGRYRATWPTVKPSWFPDEFAWVVGGSYEGLPTVTAPVRNVWSGNMAVRTDAFRSVGGFCTDLSKRGSISQPEDTDLCIRMAAATGGHWMYVPTATIDHIVPKSRASLRFFISRCFAEGRGKALMVENLESNSTAAIDTEHEYARAAVRVALRRLGSLCWTASLQGLMMLLGLVSAGLGYVSCLLGVVLKRLGSGTATKLRSSGMQKDYSAGRPREKLKWVRRGIRLVTRFEPIRRVLFKYCEIRYRHRAPAHPFDNQYGIETSGILPGSVLRLGYPVRETTIHVGYLGEQPSVIRRALNILPHNNDATFLDLGCGKGRALVVASEFPFRSVIGVEICPELAKIANRNAQVIARNLPERMPITVVSGNALDYALPEGNLIIFLYNPFGEDLIKRLLTRIEIALLKRDNRIWVVYSNPVWGHIFDTSSALSRIYAEPIAIDPGEIGFSLDPSEVVIIWQDAKSAPVNVPIGVDRELVVTEFGIRAELAN